MSTNEFKKDAYGYVEYVDPDGDRITVDGYGGGRVLITCQGGDGTAATVLVPAAALIEAIEEKAALREELDLTDEEN